MLANHAPGPNDSPQGDSDQSGSDQSASDYDTLLAALTGTARGRAFLQEYALRNRAADTATLLTAIGRIEGLLTSRGLEPAAAANAMDETAATTEPPLVETAAAASAEAEGSVIAVAAAIDAVVIQDTIAEDAIAEDTTIEYAEVAFTQGSIAGFEPVQQPDEAAPARRDPFADIRALSDVERIALFT